MCNRHPDYKPTKPPKNDCRYCWRDWHESQKRKGKNKKKGNRNRQDLLDS